MLRTRENYKYLELFSFTLLGQRHTSTKRRKSTSRSLGDVLQSKEGQLKFFSVWHEYHSIRQVHLDKPRTPHKEGGHESAWVPDSTKDYCRSVASRESTWRRPPADRLAGESWRLVPSLSAGHVGLFRDSAAWTINSFCVSVCVSVCL